MTERVLSVITIFFSGAFLIFSLNIDEKSDVLIGASAWPLFLTGLMLVLGIISTINAFRKDEQPSNNDTSDILYPKRFYLFIIYLALYMGGLYIAGFILPTFLLIILLMSLFDMRKLWKKVTVSFIGTSIFIVLFPIILNIPFPRGIGFFREITLLFY